MLTDDNTAREWRAVPTARGYEVSDDGLVRSVDRVVVCKNGSRRKYTGSPLSRFIDSDGYWRAHLWASSVGRIRPVHALVLEAFVGPKPAGFVCRHMNGNRQDNRLENLEWGTVQDNIDDMTRHGTRARGEGSPNAVLTRCSVVRIRSEKAAGRSLSSLAKEFGVYKSTIARVVKRKTWAHVE
jgi:hypothetical protein